MTGETGILATKRLKEDERAVFTQNDLARFDAMEDHVSASVEYPNAWYFAQKEPQDPLFTDWVVLLVSPHYLWQDGTRFCQRNAASNAIARAGEEAFKAMFAAEVHGSRLFVRRPSHLDSSPTDNQAELLIPDLIQLSDILGIAVRSETQARMSWSD